MLISWLILLPFLLSPPETKPSRPRPEPSDYNFSIPLAIPRYDSLQDIGILDSLRLRFGKNKVLPQGYEAAALRALSHYPELEAAKVEFVFRKNPVAHSSRPGYGSLLLGKKRRRYLVIISTEFSELLEPGRLCHLSYNAQIGVLGHELAHTLDYLQRGSGNLIGLGMRYSTSKRVARDWERFTDSTAIRHNLGYQLLAWSREVHHILEAAGRGENYLTPEEIVEFGKLAEAD